MILIEHICSQILITGLKFNLAFLPTVRTWDGGKSHVTKAVEDLKRAQRKRTYDELLDGDMDKGKVCV